MQRPWPVAYLQRPSPEPANGIQLAHLASTRRQPARIPSSSERSRGDPTPWTEVLKDQPGQAGVIGIEAVGASGQGSNL